MKYGDETRPDPDKLLAMVQSEEKHSAKGSLRIFLGMAPGVGKTYAMLEAARHKRAEGLDVLAGLVETHQRPETDVLLEGLEILPRRHLKHKGHVFEEFDLDAALVRRPLLILVDELAHANAPGSRHEKRWQDVVELLDNKIDVWSTVNVQHMDSLNDVVAQITGIRVRETFPDSLLEAAESVMLVDLPPDDLLQRIKEGKVYIPQQAELAADNFFRRGNLTALRELALRTTAQRVNTEVLVYRHGQSIHATWPTSERILVCVGPAPSSSKLVRAAKRLASALHAPWLAVFIQTMTSEEQRDSAFGNLRLAEELGAETHVLTGQNIADEIVAFARQQNVTKILVGKPVRRSWRDYFHGSPVDKLIVLSEEIDVYVIRGAAEDLEERHVHKKSPRPVPRKQYFQAAAILAACTGLNFIMYPYFELSNLIMVYLAGVTAASIWLSRGPALLVSLLSVLAFDFCFLPPRFSFAINGAHYLMTFGVMLLVAQAMSAMAGKIKRQADSAGILERQSAALASLSRELVSARGADNLLAAAREHVSDVFEHQAYFIIPDASGKLVTRSKPPGASSLRGKELGLAQWVFNNGKQAGQGTQTLPDSAFFFVPLKGVHGVAGVLGLKAAFPQAAKHLNSPDLQRLLEAFSGQIARALEVDHLEDAARKTMMEMESERLRSSLLSAVTHDFQTPLAAMAGSAESIAALSGAAGAEKIKGLAESIQREAARLSYLLANLLRIAGLESGNFKPDFKLMPMEKVVEAALSRMEGLLEGRPVKVDFPHDLPLVSVDDVLLEQLFLNLLENAVSHTPPGTLITLSARVADNQLVVEVADKGPGMDKDELERVFERFYRVNRKHQPERYGLGLSICRSIAKIHGGGIVAQNDPEGGLRFILSLPL